MATGKHTTVANELEQEILAGRYGIDGGLPSASELAKRWSFSVNTIKNALFLLEGKGLITKKGTVYYVTRKH